jgi:SAM-dependent methyltransferase
MSQDDADTEMQRPGDPILDLELSQFAAVMPRLHGARLLQIGAWDEGRRFLGGSHMPYCVNIGLAAAEGADAVTEPDALPVLSKSVQAVLLPHTLEYTDEPEALIAEAYRVLSDDGQIIVLAFNPFSRYGVTSFGGRRRGMRWEPMARTCTRLRAQGFSTAEVRRFGLRWPGLSGDSRSDRRRPWAYGLRVFSDAYLVRARKRVIPLTLVRKPARPLKPTPLAGQTAAQGHCASHRYNRPPNEKERKRCVA